MYKSLIDQFLKENPANRDELPSIAALEYFKIKLLLTPNVNEQFRSITNEFIFRVNLYARKKYCWRRAR